MYRNGRSAAGSTEFTKDHGSSVARSAAGEVNLRCEALAKLAARAVVSFERSVRVVSLDIFRVGAVEPWRRHAEPFGFPARGVGEPCSTVAGCVHGLRDMPSDVLLVLPHWLRARDAERVLASYASAKTTGAVITKLDETVGSSR